MTQSFLDALRDRVLIGDGAMGTQLYAKGVFLNRAFEDLNLTETNLVVDVHQAYLRAGAEIITFSPLAGEPPAEDCDSCWLPGGYPELRAGTLANAARFITGLKSFAASKPVHGECGGYMVLGRSLEDGNSQTHPMAGLLPVETSYARRKMHLGYRVAHLLEGGIMGQAGQRLVGHEFHYASVTQSDPTREAAFATIMDGEGNDLGIAGHRRGLVTGSFFHVISQG